MLENRVFGQAEGGIENENKRDSGTLSNKIT